MDSRTCGRPVLAFLGRWDITCEARDILSQPRGGACANPSHFNGRALAWRLLKLGSMRIITNRYLAVLLGMGWVLAAAPQARALEGGKPPTWSKQMQELATSLGGLLVDASSDATWRDPRSFQRINREASRLASLAHGLDGKDRHGPVSPDLDPSLKIIGGLFAKEAALTARLLEQGYRSYARNRFRAMTGYCMACHTRIPGGGAWSAGLESTRLAALSPLEKADYFASTRQFDRALDDYEKVAASYGKTLPSLFESERALRAGLAIAVRVKQDPERASRLIQQFLKAPQLPEYVREDIRQWESSVAQWKAERPRRTLTEEGLYAEAVRLLSEAKGHQKSPKDRAAEVHYLRLSAVVHELLALAPDGARAAEAMLMAGMSYDVLDGLHLWELHEPYYLACIQKVPHTELARQCFRHYEESVLLGFTGSAGVDIPEEVRQRLDALKREAWPLAAPSKPN